VGPQVVSAQGSPSSPPAFAVNVRDFGARGDGTTDDAAAVLAAVAALPPGGGTVWFPPGTYMLGRAIRAQKNNVVLAGAGWGTVLKLANNASHELRNVIEVYSVNGWVIRDIQIDGNRANNPSYVYAWAQHAILIGVSTHITVERVYCHDTRRNGIWIDASSSHCEILNCYVDGVNVFDTADPNGSEGGIYCAASFCRIVGNRVTRWWKGIYVAGTDNLIEANRVTSIGLGQGDGNGIELFNYPSPTGPFTHRSIVRGNHIEDIFHQGIQVGIGSDGSIIEGNVILASSTTSTQSTGILVVGADNVIIHGNVIRGFIEGIHGFWNGMIHRQTAPREA
jgi:hypothetical protein